MGTWVCEKCGRSAFRGVPFGFKPFKNFPAAPDCPFCFASRSMRPQSQHKQEKKTDEKPKILMRCRKDHFNDKTGLTIKYVKDRRKKHA